MALVPAETGASKKVFASLAEPLPLGRFASGAEHPCRLRREEWGRTKCDGEGFANAQAFAGVAETGVGYENADAFAYLPKGETLQAKTF